MRFHGERIIGIEVPYKDLSPMVREAITGNLCYEQNTAVNTVGAINKTTESL